MACCSTSLAISVSSGSTRFWRSAPTCWTRCARSRGSSCAAGDIVLIRTGALGRWWSLESDAQRLDWFSGSPGPGIACLEWFHRNEIAAGAADGSYAFLLVAQPLNLPRALGSPLNPIAIK